MAGIKSNDSAYTALRPSRILRSEKLVTSVVEVLKEDYIHPFSPTLDTQCLYNISSGVPIEDNEVLKSLNMKQVGMKLRDSFIQDCLVSGLTSFHAPIKRNNIKLFASTGRTVKLTIGKETSILKVNRNIMARLISWSVKSGKAVDFKEALRYPLCPIPLSIAFPDGSKRSTAKSKLLHELGISYAIVSDLPQQVDAYVIDVMAQIRSLHGKPDTFEDLAMKLINYVPKGVNEVHCVADSYLDNSIKSSERKSRGDNRAVIIKSIKSKIPSDFQSILKNNDSKTRIIDLLLDYIIKHRAKVLNNLRCMQIYFSKYNCCQSISLSSVKDVAYLSCKQEEADTRIFRHCQYILNVNKNAQVVIRSPSGDTDIVIIATYLLNSDCIFLDNGTGKNRNYLQINKLRISEEEKKAIIGFHAVTGNDYVSSFFGKGKRKCWKKMVSKSMFLDIVKCLGDSWDIPETFFTAIEEFICAIYNAKSKTVNAAREEIFTKKYANENKIIDLSFLPPCDTTLQLHVKRANFVAKLWKTCLDQDFTLPDIQNHGWLENGDIQWVKEVFPDDYRECLSMESEEVAYGSDTETDSETEDNI